jgi:hypothetical protein
MDSFSFPIIYRTFLKNKSNTKSAADWAFFNNVSPGRTEGTAIKDNLQVKFIPDLFRKK